VTQFLKITREKLGVTLWQIIVLGLLVGIQMSVPSAYAQTGTGVIRVVSTGSDNPGCGSAITPCKTIQYAVSIANSGDTIRLAAGTYTSATTEVVLVNNAKSVTIVGGYSTSNWNTSNPTTNLTVIDGQNARRGFHVYDVAAMSLQGVTIQNGYKTGNGNDVTGGGIYCTRGASVNLTNVVIKDNRAQGSPGNINTVTGGGLAAYNCSITLNTVTFDNNKALGANASPRGAQARGGGFFATSSTVAGQNLTVSNNQAVAGNSSSGNGMTSDGEVAQSFGGGFDIGSASTATLSNIDVQNNISQAGNGGTYGGFGSGGGVFVEGYPGTATNITITGGKINNNQAIGGNGNGTKNGKGGATGGGLMSGGTGTGGPNLTLNELEIIGNLAQGGLAANASGGALYFQAAGGFTGNNLIIANNTITPGSGGVGTGGAIEVGSNVARSLTLNYSTIANNKVTLPAVGNIISIFGSPTTFYFKDSIIANHTDKPAAAFLGGSGHSVVVNRSLWYNNAEPKFSGSGGTVVINSPVTTGNPAFVNIAGNNFHISGSSAAIDKSTVGTVSKDIDGDTRPGGSAYDVGADEYLPALSKSTKSASPYLLDTSASTSYNVTYTIKVINSSSGNVAASLADPLPTLSSVSTNLSSGPTCTGGTTTTCQFSGGAIQWNGTANANSQVTITYVVHFGFPSNYTTSAGVTTSATMSYTDNGAPQNQSLSSTIIVNPKQTNLPIVIK